MKELKLIVYIGFAYLLLVGTASQAAVVIGNPRGEITLVEILDYQCPHCQAMMPVINQLVENNKNLRVILRVIPGINRLSDVEARAVLSSRMQGQDKLIMFHNLLLSHSVVTDNQIIKLARLSGLNIIEIANKMFNSQVTGELRLNFKAFENTGFSTVPVIMIGKTKGSKITAVFNQRVPYSKLQMIITQLQD